MILFYRVFCILFSDIYFLIYFRICLLSLFIYFTKDIQYFLLKSVYIYFGIFVFILNNSVLNIHFSSNILHALLR